MLAALLVNGGHNSGIHRLYSALGGSWHDQPRIYFLDGYPLVKDQIKERYFEVYSKELSKPSEKQTRKVRSIAAEHRGNILKQLHYWTDNKGGTVKAKSWPALSSIKNHPYEDDDIEILLLLH